MTNNKSFSLVEVLVFVTILSLFFVSAVTITTFNLRNLKIQEHKILATRYAEEASEWVKQEKEDNWQVFTSHDNGSGKSYCLNILDSSVWDATSVDCDGNYNLGTPGIFRRVVLITNSGSPIVNQITTNVTTSWLENGVEQKVILKSVYNLWE